MVYCPTDRSRESVSSNGDYISSGPFRLSYRGWCHDTLLLRPGSTMQRNERKTATDVKAFVGNRGFPTDGNKHCCDGR